MIDLIVFDHFVWLVLKELNIYGNTVLFLIQIKLQVFHQSADKIHI